tara:strand:- start:49 stop:1410 length:1362 start_codon:yes stop_codon:yes gene_type:complete
MSNKPLNPKGTRDFNPITLQRRRYIIDIISSTFESFGYNEIETPSIERRSTLYHKYGTEGDKFLFNIINSGEKISKADLKAFNNKNYSDFISSISEKGLRFDLTVPLARYVSQHQNEISFPFKRFQIQNVWRADRPQKGRYQEFTQCDADVIGSDSILLEFEMIQLYSSVFRKLKLNDVVIKINHRQVLNAIAKKIGVKDNFNDFVISLDKIDKVGAEKTKEELKSKFNNNSEIDKLFDIINKNPNHQEYLKLIKNYLSESDLKLLSDLETIINMIDEDKKLINIDFDISLARGLEYYTGMIYEVSLKSDSNIGSLGGGGRYKNLTEAFNLKNNSGIGISFGLDRIFHVINDKELFPQKIALNNDILVINFGEEYISRILNLLDELRGLGKKVFIYPDNIKLSKQFSFANKNNFKDVLIYGESENQHNSIKIRNMVSGNEKDFDLKDFINNYD